MPSRETATVLRLWACLLLFGAALLGSGLARAAAADALAAHAVQVEAQQGATRAIPILEQALREREATRVDGPETALLLSSLSLAYKAAGARERTVATAQRLEAWLRGTSRSQLAAVADLQMTLGEDYRNHALPGRAVDLFKFALGLRKLVFGNDSLEAATSMAFLGLTHLQLDDYPEAFPLLEESLRIRRAKLPADDLGLAASAHNLAAALRATGQSGRAEPLYQEALRIRQAKLGANAPDVAITLTSLALLDWERGKGSRAEAGLRKAIAIYQSSNPDGVELAEARLNLGMIFTEKGDFAQAEPLLLEALKWFRAHPVEGRRRLPNVLGALAQLEQLRGNLQAADVYRGEAMSLAGAGEAEPTTQATLACDAASSMAALGRLQTALQSYFTCMQALRTTLGGDDNALVPFAMRGIALVYAQLGQWQLAEEFAGKAEGILRRGAAERSSGRAAVLDTQAVIYRATGRNAEAVAKARESAEMAEGVLTGLLAEGASDDKRAFMKTLAPNTYKVVSLHLLSSPHDEAAARLAFETLLRRKGRVLDAERDTLASARRLATAEDRANIEQLSALRRQLAAHLSKGRSEDPVAKDLTSQANTLERNLALKYPGVSSLAGPVTLGAVQKRLSASQALVEFVYFDAIPASKLDPRMANATWEYAAYVLPHDGKLRFVRLGAAPRIDALAQRFTAQLAQQEDAKATGRELDELTFAKVRPLLDGAKDVLISADGALNLVPFVALSDATGRYAIEDYLFTYVSSGRDLLGPRTGARGREVVLAVSDFGVDAQRSGAVRFPPLHGAGREAAMVRGYLPGATLLLESQVTKQALLELRGPRILHAATHGYVAPPAAGQNPLLASEIALSNANVPASTGERAVLTALEASSLDLAGTELVVLSACDVGRGMVANGDGVYGLRRALSLAGARSQLLSFWQVDDEYSYDLLSAFYAGLAQGKGRSESLRSAQLALLKTARTSSPIYWSNFTLSGDSGPLEGFAARAGAATKVSPRGHGCACRLARRESALESVWPWLGALGLAAISLRRRCRPASRAPRRRRFGWRLRSS